MDIIHAFYCNRLAPFAKLRSTGHGILHTVRRSSPPRLTDVDPPSDSGTSRYVRATVRSPVTLSVSGHNVSCFLKPFFSLLISPSNSLSSFPIHRFVYLFLGLPFLSTLMAPFVIPSTSIYHTPYHIPPITSHILIHFFSVPCIFFSRIEYHYYHYFTCFLSRILAGLLSPSLY